jgi:RNA polymerase sigma-70 factor (ECF subfamily)
MLAGDEKAFEEFFNGTFPGLFRFAASRLGADSAHAEEIAQTSLFKAISRIDSYRGQASLFTWVCAFCRHEILDFYRRRKRAPKEVGLSEETPEIREALGTGSGEFRDDPGTALGRKEQARCVRVALLRLSGHYADVLEWRYIEGASVNEIAARLEVSPKAAESLLVRARDAFREAYAALARRPALLESIPWDSL